MASPVQKTRKLLTPGTHVFTEVTYKDKHYTWTKVIILDDRENDGKWALTQEDWQGIYQKTKNACGVLNHLISSITDNIEYLDMMDKTLLSEHLTIIWCLFVHKEVYNLKWNWDTKKWEDI
jgi:hypothetical protein